MVTHFVFYVEIEKASFFGFAVAIFASYIALNLANRITLAKGRTKLVWLSCGALAMGLGIWSMHFIGMYSGNCGHQESF